MVCRAGVGCTIICCQPNSSRINDMSFQRGHNFFLLSNFKSRRKFAAGVDRPQQRPVCVDPQQGFCRDDSHMQSKANPAIKFIRKGRLSVSIIRLSTTKLNQMSKVPTTHLFKRIRHGHTKEIIIVNCRRRPNRPCYNCW